MLQHRHTNEFIHFTNRQSLSHFHFQPQPTTRTASYLIPRSANPQLPIPLSLLGLPDHDHIFTTPDPDRHTVAASRRRSKTQRFVASALVVIRGDDSQQRAEHILLETST